MNAWVILGTLLYSAIGLGYFRYATKTASFIYLTCSLLLFSYPYFCERAWQVFLFGTLISIFPQIHFYRRGR